MRTTVKWVFVPTLITLLSPYQAGALVLGEIKQNSYLNQPLDARIRVLPDQAGELDAVHISLASKSDYEKAGIEHRTPPDLIKFKLVEGKDGIPVIELTSREPIKEPLLDILLEVTWPNGHLMREYTVFLDPPAATREAAVPAEAPTSGVSGEKAVGGQAVPQQATATTAPTQAITTRTIAPTLTRDSYGPTMRPDTLWPIAMAVRPDPSVSIPQVMLAMVKKNPEAFYNNNVNELKAGYILRIPDKALINQVSQADADREVKLQYRRWMQSKKDARPPAGTTQESSPGEGRTKVTPGGAVTAAGAAQDGRGVPGPHIGSAVAPGNPHII